MISSTLPLSLPENFSKDLLLAAVHCTIPTPPFPPISLLLSYAVGLVVVWNMSGMEYWGFSYGMCGI